MPKMARSGLPTLRNEKVLVHVEAIAENMDAKTLRSSKQRWLISRLRWNAKARDVGKEALRSAMS